MHLSTVDVFLHLDVRELARAPGFPAGGWPEARAEGSSWSLAPDAPGLVAEVVAAEDVEDVASVLIRHDGSEYGVVLEFEPCHLGGCAALVPLPCARVRPTLRGALSARQLLRLQEVPATPLPIAARRGVQAGLSPARSDPDAARVRDRAGAGARIQAAEDALAYLRAAPGARPASR